MELEATVVSLLEAMLIINIPTREIIAIAANTPKHEAVKNLKNCFITNIVMSL